MEVRGQDDATILISSEPDFLQGGVTERRVRDETAKYRRFVDELDARYEREHKALDRVFVTRITAISDNPFVTFVSDEGDVRELPEPPV
jgi:arylsulfatase A-like enzyme